MGTWSAPSLPGLRFHNTLGPKQGPELLQVDVRKGNSLRKGSPQEGGRAEFSEKANVKRKRGAGGCGKPGGLGWLQPSHLSVSTRSLLSGSFRFLKKQSEGEFSLGSLAPSTLQTQVRLGLGTCHQWVGRTHAQMLLASHLQANTAVPHTGSLTAPF